MEVKVTRTNPDELMHYGVPGMKWGVRKNTKSDLTFSGKRKLRKLAKTHGDTINNIDPRADKYDRYNAIGSNTKRVMANRRKAVNSLQSTKELNSYLNEWYKNNPRKIPVNEKKHQDIVKRNTADYKRVAESYVDAMKNAYIKDLGFTDIQKAKQYLDKYL